MTRRGSHSRPERRVWQLAGVMAVAAAAVIAPPFLADPHAAVPTVAWAILVPVFALAEAVVIHLPAERSSHSLLLREIPAVIGLAFLPPQQYVTAYLVGTGMALVVWSRLRGLKLAYNTAMFALEAALGSLTFHLVFTGADTIGPQAWLAAVVAVLVTDAVSAAAVTAAISLTDSRFDSGVLREAIRTGIPTALMNTCVALLVVTLILLRPDALPLLVACFVMLVVGYRAYVRLARVHTRTKLLYKFVGSTGHTSELEDTIASILAEAAQLLQATTAELVVLPTEHEPGRQVTWRAGAVTTMPVATITNEAWWLPATSGEAVRLQRDSARLGSSSDGDRPRDGVAVALRPGGSVEGVLVRHRPNFRGGNVQRRGSRDVRDAGRPRGSRPRESAGRAPAAQRGGGTRARGTARPADRTAQSTRLQ